LGKKETLSPRDSIHVYPMCPVKPSIQFAIPFNPVCHAIQTKTVGSHSKPEFSPMVQVGKEKPGKVTHPHLALANVCINGPCVQVVMMIAQIDLREMYLAILYHSNLFQV